MLFNAEMILGFLDGFETSSDITENVWRISHIRLGADHDCADQAVLYIVPEGPETVLCRNGADSIRVAGAAVSAVFNAVAERINYYNQWQLRALNAVQQDTDSLNSLGLLTELFPDYTVKIVNPRGKFLYSSAQNPESYIDSSFISIIRSIPACYKIALGIKGVAMFWEWEHYHKNIMLGNIVFHDNSYIMFSVIEKDRSLSATELHLAQLAQSIFEKLEFTMELKTLIEPYESTLEMLLDGKEVAESLLSNLETIWDYKITNGANLILIRITTNQKFGNKALVCSINEKIANAFAFTYAKQVLCLLPMADFERSWRELEKLAAPSGAEIVFSTSFHSWSAMPRMYRQMQMILSRVKAGDPKRKVIYCADYIWDCCLWKQEEDSELMVQPDLLALKAMDDEDRFLNTFYCFLTNNCKMSATAEQLHIHLSTLKYRMEKIYNTINFDPENYRDRMSFLLSYDLLCAAQGECPDAAD